MTHPTPSIPRGETERGIFWRCPHHEQSVDVCLGFTSTYQVPAFTALYPSMRLKAAQRCCDTCLENYLVLSIPAMLSFSAAMPS